MNRAQQGFGKPKSKREVVDVIEPGRPDRRLDQLVSVRKQRLGRLERERNEAREAWRAQRKVFSRAKQARREHMAETDRLWAEARSGFLKMSTTSGQYRSSKAVYERMRKETAQYYLTAQEELQKCRTLQTAFFDAKIAVAEAQKQQEKLSIMRDELFEASRKDDS